MCQFVWSSWVSSVCACRVCLCQGLGGEKEGVCGDGTEEKREALYSQFEAMGLFWVSFVQAA